MKHRLSEYLIVVQLVKELSALYRIGRFITVLTPARQIRDNSAVYMVKSC
jgi:hypothetical protein